MAMTRRKAELTVVLRERYVRDDIPCGFESCHLCSSFPGFKPVLPEIGYTNHSKFNDKAGFYLVVDTNVVLHQVGVFIPVVSLPLTSD